MAADSDDSEAELRLKAALEGGITGVLLEGFIRVLRAIRERQRAAGMEPWEPAPAYAMASPQTPGQSAQAGPNPGSAPSSNPGVAATPAPPITLHPSMARWVKNATPNASNAWELADGTGYLRYANGPGGGYYYRDIELFRDSAGQIVDSAGNLVGRVDASQKLAAAVDQALPGRLRGVDTVIVREVPKVINGAPRTVIGDATDIDVWLDTHAIEVKGPGVAGDVRDIRRQIRKYLGVIDPGQTIVLYGPDLSDASIREAQRLAAQTGRTILATRDMDELLRWIR
ncbi:MAG: hypothetical protein IT535_10130 [Bauldia sp.]|nr:hypothetical protein [Bauldia sp.]